MYVRVYVAMAQAGVIDGLLAGLINYTQGGCVRRHFGAVHMQAVRHMNT